MYQFLSGTDMFKGVGFIFFYLVRGGKWPVGIGFK
jgi:hypothetical protein